MAFEECSVCGAIIVFGAENCDGKPCCPNCKRKAEVFRAKAKALEAKAAALESLQQSGANYKAALEHLKESPRDPTLREKTLELGRIYASWTRHAQGGEGVVTVFDEIALSNDIQAACAGAAAEPGAMAVSAEDRLRKLAELQTKRLISEAEYAEKRQQILASL